MQIIIIPRRARFDIFSPSKLWEISVVQIYVIAVIGYKREYSQYRKSKIFNTAPLT